MNALCLFYRLMAVLVILKIFQTTDIHMINKQHANKKIKGFPDYLDFYFGKNTNIEAHIVSLSPTRIKQQR
jgi:hypothetical protein